MKFTQYFSDRDGYDFAKIVIGCRGEEDPDLAAGSVDQLTDNLSRFRSALTTHGHIPSNGPLNEDLELAEYALQELKKYFRGESAMLNGKSSYIFAKFLRPQFDVLSETAAELESC